MCPIGRTRCSTWSRMSRKYPQFLPWCVGARIRSHTDAELVADLTIGFGPFRESFTSRVTLDRPGHITVRYENGPFRYLNNRWKFSEDPRGCLIDFFVDFEFRSRVLQMAIGVCVQRGGAADGQCLSQARAGCLWPASRHDERGAGSRERLTCHISSDVRTGGRLCNLSRFRRLQLRMPRNCIGASLVAHHDQHHLPPVETALLLAMRAWPCGAPPWFARFARDGCCAGDAGMPRGGGAARRDDDGAGNAGGGLSPNRDSLSVRPLGVCRREAAAACGCPPTAGAVTGVDDPAALDPARRGGDGGAMRGVGSWLRSLSGRIRDCLRRRPLCALRCSRPTRRLTPAKPRRCIDAARWGARDA